MPIPPSGATADALAARLRDQHAALARLLDGVAPGDLERRPSSGGWCAREHLAHLARYHEVFLERLGRMRAEDAPRFGRYRAEDDPDFAPWLMLDAATVLARLDAMRRALVDAVEGLTDADLARTGVHPAFGAMAVALWVEFFLAHEGHHFYALFLRARGA